MFIKERCSRCGNKLRITTDNGNKPNCFFCSRYSGEATERKQWFGDEKSFRYGKRGFYNLVWYRVKGGALRATLFNPHRKGGLAALVDDILSSNNEVKIYLADGIEDKTIQYNGTPVKIIKNCKQGFLKSLVPLREQDLPVRREK